MAGWKDTIKKDIGVSSWKNSIQDENTMQDGMIPVPFQELADMNIAAELEGIKPEEMNDPLLKDPTYRAAKAIKDSPIASGIRGVSQGATLNFADEAIAKAMGLLPGQDSDKIQSELNRALKLDQQQNPGSTLTGNVAGNFLLGKGLSTIPKIGQVLSGAEIATKTSPLSNTAINASSALGLASVGSGLAATGASEKQGSEALQEGLDAATSPTNLLAPGTYLGLKGAVAIPGIAKSGVQKIEDLLGDYYKKAKKFTEEGYELKGDDVLNSISKQAEEAAGNLRKDLGSKYSETRKVEEQIQDAQKNLEKQYRSDVKQINELNDKMGHIEKQRQIAANDQELESLNRRMVDMSKDNQKYMNKLSDDISKQYNQMDESLEKAGFKLNPMGTFEQFSNGLQNDISLNTDQKTAIMDKFRPYFKSELSMEEYRQLKGQLRELAKNRNMPVGGLAKQTLKNLGSELEGQLSAKGLDQAALDLKGINKRYSGLLKLEDDYFGGNLWDDARFSDGLIDTKGLSTIQKLGENTPEQIATSSNIQNLMKQADPTGANDQLSKLQRLVNQVKQNKNFTPDLSKIENQRQNELLFLEDMLNKAKPEENVMNKAETQLKAEDTFSRLNNKNLTDLKNLPEGSSALSEADQGTVENILKRFTNNPENRSETLEQGAAALGSTNALESAKKQADLLDTSRMINASGFRSKELPLFPTSNPTILAQQAGKAVTRRYGGLEGVSANIGRAAGNFTNNVIKNPESIYNKYKNLSAPLIEMLKKVSETPDVQKRSAIVFSMMQNPAFREELQQLPEYQPETGD